MLKVSKNAFFLSPFDLSSRFPKLGRQVRGCCILNLKKPVEVYEVILSMIEITKQTD